MADTNKIYEEIFEGAKRKFFVFTEFNGQDNKTKCKVYLPHDDRCTKEIIEGFPAYEQWLTQLIKNLNLQEKPEHVFKEHPYQLKSINLQSPVWFGPGRLGMLQAQCKIENNELDKDGKPGWLPGAAFLRGGSMGVLIIIQEDEDEAKRIAEKRKPKLYSVLTVQPRIAAGSLAFAELPAGMLDGARIGQNKAVIELKEEVGMEVEPGELINMSELAAEGISQHPYTTLGKDTPGEDVANSMYPSPGGCDEFLPLYLLQKKLSKADIEKLKGKRTGLKTEGENITLKVVPFEELWKHGSRDAKCLSALCLYENLKREKKLPKL